MSRLSERKVSSINAKLSSYLRGLSRRRSTGVVTSDDVHTFLDREGISSRQANTRLKFINSVLREPTFATVGTTPSARPAARGRVISEWVAQ